MQKKRIHICYCIQFQMCIRFFLHQTIDMLERRKTKEPKVFVLFKISNTNVWTAKHLMQASWTELASQTSLGKFAYRWHFQYHLPTSSCQRSLWTPHYIILYFSVGGGSAGSVLAARLSEDPETRVLLLEAGGSPPVLASIPVLGAFLQKTYYDWQYKTVPQKNACKAMKDQVCNRQRLY